MAGRATTASSATRRIVAVAAILASVCYALVATGSGLDRISLIDPEVANLVPETMAVRALPAQWEDAQAHGDRAGMDRLARLAVSRAPLQASSVAMYGATRQYLGQAEAADAGFRVAAKLGWRVPATQMYWLRQGLLNGDYHTAAVRLDALLRLEVAIANQPAILDVFESDPVAAAALIDQMAARPPWLGVYLADTGGLSGERLSRRIDMIDLMRQGGLPMQCSQAGPIAERLVTAGHVGEARELWSVMCGGAADTLLDDGNFRHLRLDEAGGPFRWTYAASGDVSADLAPDGSQGGQWLVAHNTASVSLALIQQRLVARAGRYRVVWSSPGDATGPAFIPATGCSPENALPLRNAQRQGADTWAATFAVSGDCNGTWLQFWLAGGGQGKLGRITLAPVADGQPG